MDAIAALSQAKSLQFQQKYSVAILKKTNEMVELTGKAAVKLIESAAVATTASSGDLGQNIDVTV
jgi:hypothetical protein